jgi:uncharacterized protein (TIGR03435 family)
MRAPSRRFFFFIALSLIVAAPHSFAQSPSTAPAPRLLSFDVASVKPIAPGGRPTHGWMGLRYRPDGMEAAYITLPMLVRYAYGYSRFRLESQVDGAPDWAASQRYDVEAKMSASNIALFAKLGKVEQEQWREEMLQSLLAERFHLALHRGSKQVSVFEMVVAKGGIKFQSAPENQKQRMIEFPEDKSTVFPKDSMEAVASFLTDQAHAELGRPIVDRTGLTGLYALTLNRWSPTISAKIAQSVTPEDAVPLSVALQEQGLHLEPSTATVEVLILDHVEPLSEN